VADAGAGNQEDRGQYWRSLNRGLESLGSVTNFEHYMETIYKPSGEADDGNNQFRSNARNTGQLPGSHPALGTDEFGDLPRDHRKIDIVG
jgi:hypothetical protein